MFKIQLAALPLLVFVLAAPALADETPIPTSDPFRINVITGNLAGPSIAGSGNGGFVAAWQGYVDAQGTAILARRLRGDGTLLGTDILVVDDDDSVLPAPQVGMAGSGNFVVVWSQRDIPMAENEVKARRYDSFGNALGPEFVVNTFSTGNQSFAKVAVQPTGTFIVSWQSDGGDGDILTQRFDSAGQPVGGPIQVAPPLGRHVDAQFAADDQGRFVAIWEVDDSGAPDHRQIQGQRYNSDGQPQGSNFVVQSFTSYGPAELTVDRGGEGSFVVAWYTYTGLSSDLDTFARRYDSAGNAQGPAFQVNIDTPSYQANPSVAVDDDGSFQVLWFDDGPGVNRDIVGQRFDAQGGRVGIPWEASVDPAAGSSGIAPTDEGQFLVVWVDDSSRQAFGRAFRLANIFEDGFESGDTTAWSTSSP